MWCYRECDRAGGANQAILVAKQFKTDILIEESNEPQQA